MSKTNIIFIHPHFTLSGGAGNVVLECAVRLDPEKYNVHVLCIRADAKYKRQYPEISFIELGGLLPDRLLFWIGFPYTQFKIHRILNQFPEKIIIPQVLPSNWWAFIYRIFHKDVMCLWYCHEPSAFIHSKAWIASITNPVMRSGARLLNPVFKIIDLFLVKNGVDDIICNSLYTKGMVRKIYCRDVMDHIYPGVDGHVFLPARRKKNYFFMLGRLTQFKKIDVAIKAMAMLQHKAYELFIGGEGEEIAHLTALSRELGIQDSVHFIGAVKFEDLPKWYAEAKLVLCTSKDEPFGMVPIEALASGTPVIGHNSGGVGETVKPDYNGVLIESLTPEDLRKTIDDLLDDPERYNRLQQNAAESVELFTWDMHVKKFEHKLDELIIP